MDPIERCKAYLDERIEENKREVERLELEKEALEQRLNEGREENKRLRKQLMEKLIEEFPFAGTGEIIRAFDSIMEYVDEEAKKQVSHDT